MCSVWHEMFKIASISVAEGAYDAPSDSLVGRGFLPSAIAASRLWRLQFPGLGRALVGGGASTTQGGIDATGQVQPAILKHREQTEQKRERERERERERAASITEHSATLPQLAVTL